MSEPEDVTKPPEGVLAEKALGEMEAPKPAEGEPGYRDPKLDTPSPAAAPVDPNYVEPHKLEDFQRMADTLATSVDDGAKMLAQGALIRFLLARVKVVEDALMPFALSAMVMTNSRMCLIADGRPTEPAGGTWISNVPSGIQLQPNEGFFFNACDAMGRTRTTEHMAAVLKKIQEAAALQAEKARHVEAGGKVH